MEVSEDLGTRMILENERVRIWEHRIGPGATGPMHVHRRPYLSVVVAGSSGDLVDPEGNVVEHFSVSPGDTYWYGEDRLPETHAFRNSGSDDCLIVTTELLSSPPATANVPKPTHW
jgi:beta-alanine degradation protein BauB